MLVFPLYRLLGQNSGFASIFDKHHQNFISTDWKSFNCGNSRSVVQSSLFSGKWWCELNLIKSGPCCWYFNYSRTANVTILVVIFFESPSSHPFATGIAFLQLAALIYYSFLFIVYLFKNLFYLLKTLSQWLLILPEAPASHVSSSCLLQVQHSPRPPYQRNFLFADLSGTLCTTSFRSLSSLVTFRHLL